MNSNGTKEMTHEEGLSWASQRKAPNETVVVAQCPHCKTLTAVYIKQTAREEQVPNLTEPARTPNPVNQLTGD